MGGEEAAALVVDNDSSMCNAGFAGDKIPRAVFPSNVGKPKMTTIVVGMDAEDNHVGDKVHGRPLQHFMRN